MKRASPSATDSSPSPSTKRSRRSLDFNDKKSRKTRASTTRRSGDGGNPEDADARSMEDYLGIVLSQSAMAPSWSSFRTARHDPPPSPPPPPPPPPPPSSGRPRVDFSCLLCGSCATGKAAMTRHMLRHLGYPNIECNSCPATFASQTAVKQHCRTQHPRRPVSCTVVRAPRDEARLLELVQCSRRKALSENCFR